MQKMGSIIKLMDTTPGKITYFLVKEKIASRLVEICYCATELTISVFYKLLQGAQLKKYQDNILNDINSNKNIQCGQSNTGSKDHVGSIQKLMSSSVEDIMSSKTNKSELADV